MRAALRLKLSSEQMMRSDPDEGPGYITNMATSLSTLRLGTVKYFVGRFSNGSYAYVDELRSELTARYGAGADLRGRVTTILLSLAGGRYTGDEPIDFITALSCGVPMAMESARRGPSWPMFMYSVSPHSPATATATVELHTSYNTTQPSDTHLLRGSQGTYEVTLAGVLAPLRQVVLFIPRLYVSGRGTRTVTWEDGEILRLKNAYRVQYDNNFDILVGAVELPGTSDASSIHYLLPARDQLSTLYRQWSTPRKGDSRHITLPEGFLGASVPKTLDEVFSSQDARERYATRSDAMGPVSMGMGLNKRLMDMIEGRGPSPEIQKIIVSQGSAEAADFAMVSGLLTAGQVSDQPGDGSEVFHDTSEPTDDEPPVKAVPKSKPLIETLASMYAVPTTQLDERDWADIAEDDDEDDDDLPPLETPQAEE